MSVPENEKLSSPSLRGAYQSAVACFRARGQPMYGSLPPIRGSCGPDPEVNLNPPSPPRGSPTQMPSVPSTRSIPVANEKCVRNEITSVIFPGKDKRLTSQSYPGKIFLHRLFLFYPKSGGCYRTRDGEVMLQIRDLR